MAEPATPKVRKVRNLAYVPLVFQDRKGEWRWSLRHPNGKLVATSGEGYKNRSHARRMAHRLFPLLAF